jgi:hypothetical protein
VVGRKIDANPGCGTQDKTRGNEGKQREKPTGNRVKNRESIKKLISFQI